jgi:hypothetical protein
MASRAGTVTGVLVALFLGWVVAERCQAQLQPLTKDERSAILERVLERREVAAFAETSRVRALAVVPAEAPDKTEAATSGRRFAEVLLIGRGQPGAIRLLVSVPQGEVLRTERLPGRPQSSVDERAEARRLLQSENLASDAVLEGGFVVDPPPGAPADGRYLEFHVLDAARSRILRELTVDLATQKVYEGRSPDAPR